MEKENLELHNIWVAMTLNRYPKKVRTNDLIRKVRQRASLENPPIQKPMAMELWISPAMVNKIINKDLKLKLIHKLRVHKLLPRREGKGQLKNETSISSIPFDHIPTKSPDAVLMDFYAFGLLDGLWKVAQQEWHNTEISVLRSSLISWNRFRVTVMS